MASTSIGKVQDSKAAPSSSRTRRWLLAYPRAIPFIIFTAIAAITLLSVFAIESNARAREKAQMREYTLSIASELQRRGSSFSSYLRAGAALFASLDEVTPQIFRQFVSELRLDLQERGAEGIGWITIEQAGGKRRTPVTYFYPDTVRNRRALGFDMSSEPIRAAAMEEARRLVRPTASAKIVLSQEGAGDAPGFIVFMPVYRPVRDATGNRGVDRELTGFVYSPFSAERFLESAVERADQSSLGVALYDGAIEEERVLVSPGDDGQNDRFSGEQIDQVVSIANRDLLLSVQARNGSALAPLSMVTLLFGAAVAGLLMLLARLLTRQAMEDQASLAFFEEQHSIRNSLTRELNHRVKNTLANVLSILSLTRRRTRDLDEFANSLEGRIRALSATHDLLTVTDWGTTPIQSVIEAELQHLRSEDGLDVIMNGPYAELAPNDALSFGLAIHELATNAAKYGAFSVPDGRVRIEWETIDENLAQVTWREENGPPVTQERKPGFGTELIEKIVAHELRQPVKLSFDPGGVRCEMRIPIRKRSSFQIREA